MRDSIYTIPVNEVFEPRCGCPICTMRDTLEERCLEYIMGAAMMEPDVRIETNQKGFCRSHFGMMLERKNRLSLALMLESHLQEVLENGLKPPESQPGGFLRKKGSPAKGETCFVCEQVEWALGTMVDTLLRQYAGDESFRTLYTQQQLLCYPHYRMLTGAAQEKLEKKYRRQFFKDSRALCEKTLKEISGDVSHYCKMFDYRSQGSDWGNSKDSIERAVYILTSRTADGE